MEAEEKVHPTPLHFHYDEFCDLLGGAAWDQAVERWRVAGLSPDRERRLAPFSSRFSSSSRSLFPNDPALYPLETLWLKWNLFAQLCDRIEGFHRDFRRPHLRIQPAYVWVTVPDAISDFLPSRWSFSLKLAGLEPVLPVSGEIPSEFAPRIFSLPPDLKTDYVAPVMKGLPLGHEESVTALIHSMERFREPVGDKVRGMVQVNLISENIRPADYSEMDVFRVTLKAQTEIGQRPTESPVRIWGTKLPDSERGLLVSGATEAVSPSVWETVEKNRQAVFSYSKVAIYKSYHVPCDLYSLGMMLLRSLFVNDRQELGAVDEMIKEMIHRLKPMVQGLGFQDDRIIAERLRESFQKEGLFKKEAVLYRLEDRTGGADMIPDDLWEDQLILALRLLTSIPGFSFCRNHGDYPVEHPERLMQRVMLKVRELSHRIKIALFGSRERNREILEACAQVRKEFSLARNHSNAF